MSQRYLGGFITNSPVQPTSTVAKGSFTLQQQMQAQAAANWPAYVPKDPYFFGVSLLLNGDGTNGAQNNTFLDSSTNNFTITRNGNTTQGSFSPYGSLWSNFLNGSSYLSLSSNTALNLGSGDFTIEAFINFSSLSSNRGIVYSGTDPNSNFGYGLQWSSNALYFWYTTNGSNLASQSVSWTPSVGVWYHLAVTRNGNDLKFFVNGTQTGSTQSLLGVTIHSSTSNMRVGGEATGSPTSLPGSMNGFMSNFRLVKGTAVYTANFTPPVAPLTAISGTSILTCQSNRFIDNSSNNFTITPNGSPSVQRFSPFNPTAPYSTSVIGGSGYIPTGGSYPFTSPASSNTSLGSGNFTVEGWVYTTSVGAYYNFLVGKWEYPNKEWFLQYTASSISFYLSTDGLNDSATFTVSTTVPLNAWNHIAVTRSSSNLYIFLNGTLVSTQSITQTFYAATQVVSIGNFPFGGISDTGMRGYVSDVRLVKGTALYTSSFTPPTAPLTAVSNTQLLTNFTNAGIPDLAMMNNLETVGNAQVSTSVKKYGTGSLYFDGNGDYLTSPSSVANGIGSGDFTFECWIYQLGSGDGQSVWDCRTTGTQAAPCFIIQQSTNLPRFVVNGADTITATTPIPVNTWTHFAICRSGTSLRMFVNGTQTGSTYTDTTTYVSSMPMNLGTYVPSPANNYYVGYLDDVRFTKGYARYTANFTPPTAAFSTS